MSTSITGEIRNRPGSTSRKIPSRASWLTARAASDWREARLVSPAAVKDSAKSINSSPSTNATDWPWPSC